MPEMGIDRMNGKFQFVRDVLPAFRLNHQPEDRNLPGTQFTIISVRHFLLMHYLEKITNKKYARHICI